MLLSLHVKNLALIDETEIYLEPGLNILTGETGAGKSVLIGSINLALGAKADKEVIRAGADAALVELTFATQEENVINKLQEFDIPMEEDTVTISRRIQSTRSICKINGETVSAKQVKELAELLIDIHGQHEHQSLLHKKKHMEILDTFSGEALIHKKEELKICYHAYQKICAEISHAKMDEAQRNKAQSMAEFEVNEITEAALKTGEDDELENRYRKMVNSKRIGEAISLCYRFSGYDSEDGAGAQLGRALRELRGVASYDQELGEMEQQLGEIDNLVNDFNRALSDYMVDMEFDQSQFLEIETRLDLINHLKNKYGATIEDIIAYGEEQQRQLDRFADYDNYMEQLFQEENKQKETLFQICEEVSSIREKAAKVLSNKMQEALKELNFLTVKFEIQVLKDKEPSLQGFNQVEFLISTNPGESIKPLVQVASGGELSRIMLAIKTVLAQKDSIDTLIFDEIDAGISGKTAWQVSKQLGILGKAHQVICITHLPQIAAMADTHFLIQKNTNGVNTATTIEKLEEESSTQEIARLLGGEKITDAVLLNAKEIRQQAEETKK